MSNPPLNRLLYPLHCNINAEEVDFKRSEAYSTISVNKLTIDEKKRLILAIPMVKRRSIGTKMKHIDSIFD